MHTTQGNSMGRRTIRKKEITSPDRIEASVFEQDEKTCGAPHNLGRKYKKAKKKK
jgi:hypothetical protein